MSLATRNQVWTALPPMRFGEVRPLDLDLDATTLCVLLAARLANYNGGCGSELRVCGPRGARTHNLRIKSPQLCQLS